MIKDEITIKDLNFLLRVYDSLNKHIVSTANRLKTLNPEAKPKHDDILDAMEKNKGVVQRRMEKLLKYWPIWTEWMQHLNGVGPYIAGNLIMNYYYRFIPTCKKCGADLVHSDNPDKPGYICSGCGKAAKRDGVLQHRLDFKKFNHISAWWKYNGMHCDETGRKPMRKKGVKSDWSTRGRVVCYQFGQQVTRKNNDYNSFYEKRVKYRAKTHADKKEGIRKAMARHETAKLFLSHFIQVAKQIEGEKFTRPYVQTFMGHEGVLEPFRWNPGLPN